MSIFFICINIKSIIDNMSEINIKKTYDENDEQVYAETSISAVVGLSDALNNIKGDIKKVKNDFNIKINSIEKEIENIKNNSNNYDDTEIQSKILEMEKTILSLNIEITSLKG